MMFVQSGIDIDGSQAHLVTSPLKDKPNLPRLDFRGANKRPIASPHELNLLKSELYYMNSPNNANYYGDPLTSPAMLLPNSCRVTLDRRSDRGSSGAIASARPV